MNSGARFVERPPAERRLLAPDGCRFPAAAPPPPRLLFPLARLPRLRPRLPRLPPSPPPLRLATLPTLRRPLRRASP